MVGVRRGRFSMRKVRPAAPVPPTAPTAMMPLPAKAAITSSR